MRPATSRAAGALRRRSAMLRRGSPSESMRETSSLTISIAHSYFFLRIRVFLLLVLAIGLDFDLEEVGLITLMSSGAIGEPRPVHASQPAPAAKLPLFPWIMSRKAALPLAA